jgi:hypothetical protein
VTVSTDPTSAVECAREQAGPWTVEPVTESAKELGDRRPRAFFIRAERQAVARERQSFPAGHAACRRQLVHDALEDLRIAVPKQAFARLFARNSL